MKTALALPLLLTAIAASGAALAAPAGVTGESWVPVVMLKPEGGVPLKPGLEANEVVMGFVQVSDLEDGLPLRIGWYRVEESASLAGTETQSLPLVRSERAALSARTEQRSDLRAGGCDSAFSPIDPGKCLRLGPDLASLGVQADYRLGSTVLSLGVEQTRYGPDTPRWLAPGNWQLAPLNGMRGFSQDSVLVNSRFQTQVGTFDLGMQLAQTDLGPLLGEQLNQGRFSISWLHGNLGGALSARAQRLDRPDADFWGGIDLGLIWRTPWNGLLSIGARNLISGGRPPAALDPEVAPLTDSEERIPYVRYEQDL